MSYEGLYDGPDRVPIELEESGYLGRAVFNLSEICTGVECYCNDRLAYDLRNSSLN